LSPSVGCVDETLSTLKFAQRAKAISNIVVRNEETTGSVLALQREIEALKAQLFSVSSVAQEKDTGIACGSAAQGAGVAEMSAVLTSLSSSLQRCHAVDEVRKREAVHSVSLAAKLEQSEKIVLGLEMKLKMRDSEIQRLKRTQTVAGDADDGEISVDTLKAQLIEVTVVRDKTQAELLKYRQAIEEIQRRIKQQNTTDEILRLGVDENVSVKTLFKALWTPSEEEKFQHLVNDAVDKLIVWQSDQATRFEALVNHDFETLTGLSTEETKDLKQTLLSTQDDFCSADNRCCIAESQLCELRLELNATQQARERFEREAGVTVSGLQQELTRRNEYILKLERDVSSKDNVIQQLDVTVRTIEQAASSQLKQQESEMKASYLRAMKDNALLLRSYQELEAAYQEVNNKVTTQASALIALEESSCVADKAHNEFVASLQNQLSLIESDVLQKTQVISVREQDLSILGLEVNSLREEKRRMQGDIDCIQQRLQILQSDHEKVCFERDSLEDDNENNMVLVDSLRVERENFIEIMTSLETQNAQCAEQLAVTKDVVTALDEKVTAAETENTRVLQELGVQQNAVRSLQIELSQSLQSAAIVKSQNEKYAVELATLQSNIEELSAEKLISEQAIQTLQHQNTVLVESNNKLSTDVTSERNGNAILRQDLDSALSVNRQLEGRLRDEKQQFVGIMEKLAVTEQMKAGVEAQLFASAEELSAAHETNKLLCSDKALMEQDAVGHLARLGSLELELQSVSRQLTELDAANDELSSRLCAKENKYVEVVGQLDTLRDEALRLTAARENLQTTADELQTRLDEECVKTAELISELVNRTENARRANQCADNLIGDLQLAKTRNDEISRSYANALENLQTTTDSVATLERQLTAAESELAQKSVSLAEALEVARKLSDRLSEIDPLTEKLKQEKETLMTEIQVKQASFNAKLDNDANTINELEAANELLLQKLATLQKSVADAEGRVDELKILQSKYTVLQSDFGALTKNYEDSQEVPYLSSYHQTQSY
jgi:kinesin family protein 15